MEETFLLRSAALGKLAHAYLLSGNDEQRKREAVSLLLQELACKSTKKPCGACRTCLEIEQGLFPDLHVVTAGEKKEIGIEAVRSMAAAMSLSPWNAPYKIALIEDAHCMTREAQSALLKLLEEPKGQAVFFLLTPYPGVLLQTIRSRTQEVKFLSFQNKTRDANLEKILLGPLYLRFAFAKNTAESQELPAILLSCLETGRSMLRESLEKGSETIGPLYRFVTSLQDSAETIQMTNTNSRLALERAFIEL